MAILAMLGRDGQDAHATLLPVSLLRGHAPQAGCAVVWSQKYFCGGWPLARKGEGTRSSRERGRSLDFVGVWSGTEGQRLTESAPRGTTLTARFNVIIRW